MKHSTKGSRVKISTLKIDLGDTTIELTLKQAQALKDALNDTFGEKVTQYVYPYHHYYPHPYTTWAGSPATSISDSSSVTAYASSTGALNLALPAG